MTGASLHALCVDRHEPDARALVTPARTWTFGEVALASARLATHLRHAEGVERGARVGIVLAQRVENALLHLACSRIGAIAVPLSPLFGPDGLRARLGDAGASVVFTTEDHRATVREATQQVSRTPVLDQVSRTPVLQAPVRCVEESAFVEAMRLAQPMSAHEQARPAADDAMWLIYTSGTSGMPKGALLPHRVIAGRMSGFDLAHDGLDPEFHLFYSPADWSWIGGLHDSLFAPWHAGVAVLAHERRGAFDPEECYRLLKEHDVTDAFFAPTALKALARAVAAPPVRLRVVHSAGEPLPAPVGRWARRHLAAAVTEVYGLTEAAFLIGTAAEESEVEAVMGTPFPGHWVELLDDDPDASAATSSREGRHPGEICVKDGDPTLMLGYWKGEGEKPDLPLDERGYLHTGDLAEVGADGLWRYLGRRDDLIKTGGYRVGPAEVEAALLHHPAVAECAVVGVPDDERGQRVKAFVVPASRVAATPALAAQLQEFVKARLAAHAYPRELEFVAQLPMTVSGKVVRRRLRGA